MPFPSQVNVQGAIGVAGDFSTANPRSATYAPAGQFVAGSAGVTVGRFAWQDLAGNGTVSNVGLQGGLPAGFVGRDQNALITTYLAEASMVIPQGMDVTLYNSGDFFVVNSGSNEATIGMKAYANYANGLVTFAPTGSPTQATSTATSIAAATAISCTGSINNNVLTVTSVASGTLVAGATISGSGVATGTQITAQLSGTTGGIGTYSVSIQEQTVASTAIAGTYGTMTVGGTITGTFGVGNLVAGSGVTAGTTIWGFGTGSGGAGTYIVSPSQTASSTAVTANANIETRYTAQSYGAPGELVSISSHPFA